MWAGGASNIGEVHLELSQPNQDNYLINEERKVFAVFDGHGDQGHVVSAYLREHLASTFFTSADPSQPMDETLRTTFKTLDENICKSTPSESSGSTCVMAYVHKDTLYVAGVGDCSALLVQANPTSGKIDTTPLLSVHKISNESEHARIQKTGAQIAGEYVICLSDPNKVINMTRAFGDQDMKSAGIISQPDISITSLSGPTITTNGTHNHKDGASTDACSTTNTNYDSNVRIFDTTQDSNQNDTFLMLFSDGLEQVQSTEEIVQKTHQLLRDHVTASKGTALKVSEICSNLLKQLEDAVYDRDGIGFNDDTTVCIIMLSGFAMCTS